MYVNQANFEGKLFLKFEADLTIQRIVLNHLDMGKIGTLNFFE